MRPSASLILPEAEQAGVRVGAVREPLQHRREQRPLDVGRAGDTGGERLEVAQRRAGVVVPQRGEAGLRRFGREAYVVAGIRATADSSGR